MNDPQENSPRRRLQTLLAIPERQRTDEQWDEINELEISLTAINRANAPTPEQGMRPAMPSNRNHHSKPNNGKPSNGMRDKKPAQRSHKRPPKPKAP